MNRTIACAICFLMLVGVSYSETPITVVGYNTAGTTTYEVATDYSAVHHFPAAAAQMKVSSSSTDDTVLGTGARTVTVYGLDSLGAQASETVSMNGTAQVTTTASFLRVNRAEVITAGTYAAASGEIYIHTGGATAGVPDTATLIYAQIKAGNNQTFNGAYTVPAGKTATIKKVTCLDTDNAKYRIRYRPSATGLWKVVDFFQEPGKEFTGKLPSFGGLSDIILEGENGTTTTAFSMTMDLVLN